MTCPPLPSPLPQGARESFLVLKACHYEEKTIRAECEAACRKDRLSAGQVGRLGVTFKARRSKQMEHRLIQRDVVILNTEHHCHPELVSGSQKLRRFRNMSWIIGRSAGSTQPSLGRVSLSLNSYQNPQFGMTINNIPLFEIKDFGPPARGGHFVLFHSFLPPQPYGTQFHTAHSSPVLLVSLPPHVGGRE